MSEEGSDAQNLEEFENLTSDTKRWKAKPEVEAMATNIMKDAVPLDLRLSDQMIEQAYDRGHQLYKTGHYKEAIAYFRLINILNPKHPKYLMSLGASYHMLKDYEVAQYYYNMACMFDDENPIPIYHMADCLIKMDDPLNALIALEVGLPRCDSSPRFAPLKDRMKMMIQQLDSVIKEKVAKGELKLPSDEEEPPEESEILEEAKGEEISEEDVIVDEERISESMEEGLEEEEMLEEEEEELTEEELALEEMTEDELLELMVDLIEADREEEQPSAEGEPPPKEGA